MPRVHGALTPPLPRPFASLQAGFELDGRGGCRRICPLTVSAAPQHDGATAATADLLRCSLALCTLGGRASCQPCAGQAVLLCTPASNTLADHRCCMPPFAIACRTAPCAPATGSARCASQASSSCRPPTGASASLSALSPTAPGGGWMRAAQGAGKGGRGTCAKVWRIARGRGAGAGGMTCDALACCPSLQPPPAPPCQVHRRQGRQAVLCLQGWVCAQPRQDYLHPVHRGLRRYGQADLPMARRPARARHAFPPPTPDSRPDGMPQMLRPTQPSDGCCAAPLRRVGALPGTPAN